MKYRNDYHSGFTLIELLVVISIVALLSSVVLAAVSSANKKAKDAAIKQLALQMRNVYELEYSKSGNYLNLMPPSSGGFVPNGYSCSYTDNTKYNCNIKTLVGCTNVNALTPNVPGYASGLDANSICKSIMTSSSNYWFGIDKSKSSNVEYSLFIQYPSSATGYGFCLRGDGSVLSSVLSTDCL